MKAIEILFNKIDELNSQIKLEKDIDKKVFKVMEIKQIVKIIEEMKILKEDEYLCDIHIRNCSKDYI